MTNTYTVFVALYALCVLFTLLSLLPLFLGGRLDYSTRGKLTGGLMGIGLGFALSILVVELLT